MSRTDVGGVVRVPFVSCRNADLRDTYPRPGHPLVTADATDRLLVSGLGDGRMSYANLAELAGLSAAATRSRVLRIIRGGAVYVMVLVDAAHTGRLARAGLGITVHGPTQATAEQIAGLPDVTYVFTGDRSVRRDRRRGHQQRNVTAAHH